jgi:hypothetical protein
LPSAITRLLLFLSSYFPLSLIFFVILVAEHSHIATVILALGAGGLLWMLVYLRTAQRLGGMRVTLAGFQRRDAEAMAYVVTYVIPFLAIPFSGWREAIALTIFLVVLGILYVNSNMIHINPMLNLFGYHLYEVTLEDGGIHSLITHRRIRHRAALMVVKVGDDILLEKQHGTQ